MGILFFLRLSFPCFTYYSFGLKYRINSKRKFTNCDDERKRERKKTKNKINTLLNQSEGKKYIYLKPAVLFGYIRWDSTYV